MRHTVNFGLLISFSVLATSGVLSYGQPFSLLTARIHIVAALATIVLVGLHLVSRLPYFRAQLAGKGKAISRWVLAAVVMTSAVALAAAIGNWWPVRVIVNQSYESRERVNIVRSSPLAGFLNDGDTQQIVARSAADPGSASLALLVRFRRELDEIPVAAVWAETTTGSLIETLYLDPRVAYSDKPEWKGQPTSRNEILPIWRHRYTLVSGVAPGGGIDAATAATPSHSFSLDSYLDVDGDGEFVLCVELNAAGDPNEHYPDELRGQPSLLYTAYIDLSNANRYALLELTGHGGGDAATSGAIQYDLDNITTAAELIDLLLAKTAAMESPP